MKLIDNIKISKKQRGSIHVYFEELSNDLLNSGVDFNVMLRDVTVSPTPKVLKDVFRFMGEFKFGAKSTEDLTPKQVMEVWEDYNVWLSKYDVHIPFPSVENTDEYLSSFIQ